MSVHIKPLTGAALAGALPDLARLRIAVFREWPYLYDGTLDYEQSYLAKFSNDREAVIVAAYDADAVVGIATASPLAGHADAFFAPLSAYGFDPARIFYCGESILLAAYRGRGIGHAFFDAREAHARGLSRYTQSAFCCVVRSPDHPLRPADYAPLDAFWRKRGYAPAPGVVASIAWKDVDEPAETAKPMQFWMRDL